jgi:hypothetical protein
LAEGLRVLKPGGIFIATCPVPFWDHLSGSLGLHKDEYHAWDMRKQQLTRLLRAAGFSQIQYGRFMWAPVSFLPYLYISISPKLSVSIDRLIPKVLLLNWLFVNQYAIGQKPLSGI